jgi:hypothetical protein
MSGIIDFLFNGLFASSKEISRVKSWCLYSDKKVAAGGRFSSIMFAKTKTVRY